MRWYQFRLRTAFVLFAIAAFVLAWFGTQLHGSRRQHAIVSHIVDLGGCVTYDDGSVQSEFGCVRFSEPSSPEWLRTVVGDEFFVNPAEVLLDRCDVTDNDLVMVAQLQGIERLSVRATPISDNGLSHLASLQSLRGLDLSDMTRITDSGLSCLESLTQLEVLVLCDSNIGDGALDHLQSLKRLKLLDLRGTAVTDLGMRRIETHQELETLYLSGCRITSAGLLYLRDLPHLRGLDLSGTRVCDAGLETLSHVRSIEELNLTNTSVRARSKIT